MAVRTLSPARFLDPAWLLGMDDGVVVSGDPCVLIGDSTATLVLLAETHGTLTLDGDSIATANLIGDTAATLILQGDSEATIALDGMGAP
jgi:hypothetical protein